MKTFNRSSFFASMKFAVAAVAAPPLVAGTIKHMSPETMEHHKQDKNLPVMSSITTEYYDRDRDSDETIRSLIATVSL